MSKKKNYENMTLKELADEETIHLQAIKEIFKVYTDVGIQRNHLITELLLLNPSSQRDNQHLFTDILPISKEKQKEELKIPPIEIHNDVLTEACPMNAEEIINEERKAILEDINSI